MSAVLKRSALLLAVFAIGLLSVGSRASAAGEFELLPCFAQNVAAPGYGEWASLTEGGSGPWSLAASCPSEAQFKWDGSGSQPDAGWRGFEFPKGNSEANTIKTLSFDLLGGDGSDGWLEQGLMVCSPTTCSTPIKPAGANQTIALHYTLTSAALPPGANRVVLAGRCSGAHECATANPLRIKNIDIIFTDRIKPTVAPSAEPIDATLPPLSETDGQSPGTWQSLKVSPFVRYDVVGTDDESGVQYIQFEIFRTDTFPPQIAGRHWEDKKFCGVAQQYKIGALCPHVLHDEFRIQPQGAINNYGIREGLNLMKTTAFDAAGNRSDSISTWFLVDSISPKVSITSPAGPGTHWQAGPTASVSWSNSESDENNYDSGLAAASWTVRDATTGAAEAGFAGGEGGAPSAFDSIPLPGDGVWDIDISTRDRAGNMSGAEGSGTTRIGVDSTVLGAPEVEPLTTLGTAAIAEGVKVRWSPPADASAAPSGICGYATVLDASADTVPAETPDLGGDAQSTFLDGELIEGTNYFHVRAVTCAGVAGEPAHLKFEVDRGAPLLTVSAPGSSGWYSEEHPLTASIAGAAPGDSISAALDGGSNPFGPGPLAAPAMIDGEHQFTATAKDSVGNVSTYVGTVWIDVAAPEVELAPRDPRRPAAVTAIASDAASGVKQVSVQYRSAGSGDWQEIAGPGFPSGSERKHFAYTVNVPDEKLPGGAYELRAVAMDVAGHVSYSPTPQRSVTLPLRSAPSLSVGFVKRTANKRAISRDFALVGLGGKAKLSGSISAAAGEAIAGARIEIVESRADGRTRPVASVVTDARGGFSYNIVGGQSRRVSARFAGDELSLPAEATAKFLVRPRVTLRVAQRNRGARTQVVFSGRVTAPGAKTPSGGLPVRIEFVTGGDKVIYIPTKAFADGRFKVAKRFRAGSAPLVYSVRAVVPWFNGWPYETGRSPQKRFVVR